MQGSGDATPHARKLEGRELLIPKGQVGATYGVETRKERPGPLIESLGGSFWIVFSLVVVGISIARRP